MIGLEEEVGYYAPLESARHEPSAEAELLAVMRSTYAMFFNEMPPSRPEDSNMAHRAGGVPSLRVAEELSKIKK